ncbi:protein-glutamine gamma-glutamyltransferase 2-like [Salmo trutta]|uniref:protein-glutamine gamma-glutamyltransferase 2-like n=3 Tax=Salmo trutta TaxID=8032 RepID=UPI0011323536|nr:protein-glutamine gamma-glutamyltransferase 2-like [Salmo trutta]XP_029604365.1 protein-glutamine gamma-glutamyltransferase 2-like [Salmo trutta]
MGFDVGKVELHCEKNNKAHKTNDISVNRLIVRRGQSFLVTFELHGPSRPTTDLLELKVETGPQPSEALGTRSVFRLPEGCGKGSSWKVKVHQGSVFLAGSITLDITSPADAPVGEYRLSVKTSATASVGSSLGKLLLLFNPWCKEDWVHLPEEEERQEYVMREQGLVYKGSDKYISSMAWNFGQFEDDIVDICLKLLDVNPKCLCDPAKDFSARCNPIYVSRVVSAMINANDDRGVLMGRWDGRYDGGMSPTHWNGSVEVLRRWLKNGSNPVKYGQCWVFAAVMCTVLRCLGIPCRVVSNFQSAHDTDKNLTIDYFFSDYGVRPKQSPDSVWNYHVWVEAWMRRPDLSAGSLYDGWQVVDPTPQEKSTDVYCCGPAPVKAILQGHVDLKYDVPFVFAEVNADRVTWMVFADGSKKKISTDSVSVGQNISTKAVGSDKRVDITANYKHAEGTKMERAVYNLAVKRVNIPGENSNGTHDCKPGVSMKIVELTKPVSGKNIDLKLILNSNDSETRTLVINVNVQAMRYNGIPSSQIQTELKKLKLLPNQDLTIPIHIPFSVYGEKMRESNSIKVSAVVTDKDKSEAVYITEKDLVPESPSLTIKAIGSELQYSEMTAEVVFENPLSEGLRNCFITVTGSGLLTETMEARMPLLKQGQRLRVTMPFTPYRPGPKKLVAGFNCDQFRDIKASCNVYIKPVTGVVPPLHR